MMNVVSSVAAPVLYFAVESNVCSCSSVGEAYESGKVNNNRAKFLELGLS